MYLQSDEVFEDFISYPPDLRGLEAAIAARRQIPVDRPLLYEVLSKQYREIGASTERLKPLLTPDTYTVTAAHQPVLAGGPLYTVYKIAAAIHLSTTLTKQTGQTVLPVFVIGTEDHDFEEISRVHLFGKTIQWEAPKPSGPVGRMPIDRLIPILQNELYPLFGKSSHAPELRTLFDRAFRPGRSYGRSYQAFILGLFEGTGLLVLDMDDARLKHRFQPILHKELTGRPTKKLVLQQQEALYKKFGYAPQIFVRDVNLFYQTDHSRLRIDMDGGSWTVTNTDIKWDRTKLQYLLERHPERFSPNVALRPVFQEQILPNLAFIGGPSEVAYWMEIKEVFSHFGVHFPVLLRRPSALWIPPQIQGLLQRYHIFEPPQLFSSLRNWETIVLQQLQPHLLEHSEVFKHLDKSFEYLHRYAQSEDLHLNNFLEAAQTRLNQQMEGILKKIGKQIKQKHEVELNRLSKGHALLFPNGKLQERYDNFIPAYLEHGTSYLRALIDNLDPLQPKFTLLLPD